MTPATLTAAQARDAVFELARIAGRIESAEHMLALDYIAQTLPVAGPRVGVEAALEVAVAGLEGFCSLGESPALWRVVPLAEALLARVEAVRRGDVAGDEPWGDDCGHVTEAL